MRTMFQVLLTVILFQACIHGSKQEQPKTTATGADVGTANKVRPDTIASAPAQAILPTDLPVRQIPLTDSTNFDNFQTGGIPAEGFIKRVGYQPEKPATKNFRLHYTIPFSQTFTTVAISYQSGDHELFTTLLTINSDNKIIDQLDIAYDEIAESAFSKTSRIQDDKILVMRVNWMGEAPTYERETYVLQSNGKFKIDLSAL